MRGPEDFGAAFTALLEAAGATPDSVVRALGGTVARSVLYDWKNGAHLPSDTRPLLEVVKLCLRLARDGADLRGAPADLEGWLNLLAEAKQSRDNQAAGGRSSLRGLDRDTLWQIANFLAQHASSLLAVLGELAASRPSDADKLIRRLEELKGRNQTPQCVVKPKILPAADLSVAYRRVDLLRTYRRALRGPGLADDRLLATISALRGVLEEIYRVRIVFVGEKVPKRTDNTGSTTPDAPLIPADPGIDFDPRIQDPIITSVKVLPGLARATIVAEGNPPEAVTPSGSIFVITVEARAPRAVILHGARAVVLDRQPPRRACFIKGIAGVLKVRRFDVDLDSENPELRMQGEHDFPLTVRPDDPEEFWVQAVTATNEITWTIALDWTVNGIHGTTLVNHNGPPFSLYPIGVLLNGPGKQSLRTACDHGGHEEGCPALTLTQLGGSTSTFSSARDLDNGCLYTGIPALREMVWDGGLEQDPDHDEDNAEDGS
jgi:hypothetical protein